MAAVIVCGASPAMALGHAVTDVRGGDLGMLSPQIRISEAAKARFVLVVENVSVNYDAVSEHRVISRHNFLSGLSLQNINEVRDNPIIVTPHHELARPVGHDALAQGAYLTCAGQYFAKKFSRNFFCGCLTNVFKMSRYHNLIAASGRGKNLDLAYNDIGPQLPLSRVTGYFVRRAGFGDGIEAGLRSFLGFPYGFESGLGGERRKEERQGQAGSLKPSDQNLPVRVASLIYRRLSSYSIAWQAGLVGSYAALTWGIILFGLWRWDGRWRGLPYVAWGALLYGFFGAVLLLSK
jgi:hypothetical protein